MNNQKKEFNTFNVLLISFAHWTHDIFTSFLAPLLPIIKEKLDISYSWLGLLAIMQRIPTILNLFIGILADKFPIRYILILAPAVTAICMSLIGLANNVVTLAILLFISGISSMFFHIPASVMVKKMSGDKLGKGMSFYMVGGELARTMGPIIVLGAYSVWGLEGIWKLIPFGILTSIFMYFRFKKIKIAKDFSEKPKLSDYKQTFIEYLPILGAIAFFNLSRAALKASFTTFLPSYINDIENNLWLGGIMLSLLQFSGVIGIFFSGSISDKIGRKKCLLIISAITPVIALAYIFSSGILSYFLIGILGVFMFASSPIALAVVHDIKTKHLSFINGIYLTINFLFGAIMIWLTGLCADIFGFRITYIAAACLAFCALPFVISIFNKTDKN